VYVVQDQVFMTWTIEVDGLWGPYMKCNPRLDKGDQYNGFQCGCEYCQRLQMHAWVPGMG